MRFEDKTSYKLSKLLTDDPVLVPSIWFISLPI